jgi:hypothetical protein
MKSPSIEAQYELVTSIYVQNSQQIDELISKSKFPMAFECLKNFSFKLEEMKRSLEALESIEAFYSSQSLSRILHEHFLVAFYIWTKCRVEDSDECAEDYMRYYPLFELIKRDNYNSKLDKTYDTKITPLQNFLSKNPDFQAEITEEDVLDINKRANKFDIRNILKFMQEDLDEMDAFKSFRLMIANVCKEYNVTSSYVHGGRIADMQTFDNVPVTRKEKVTAKNSGMAKVYACHILSFIMLLLIKEFPEFANTYRPVIDLISNDGI